MTLARLMSTVFSSFALLILILMQQGNSEKMQSHFPKVSNAWALPDC